MMNETSLNPSRATTRRGRGTVAALLAGLVLLGGAGAAWYAWQHGWINPEGSLASSTASTLLASPSAAPTESPAAAAAIAGATAQITALEQRLAELNQQALAASGNATHAEALLVAFSVRRAIERGQPLGYLEPQLRMRFGDSQSTAVDRVIRAAAKPVTQATLTEEFADLEPVLIGGSPNEGTWTWLKREVGQMFVIRHDDMPSPTPQSRLQRARKALAGGRIDAAILEVERMPGRDSATEWLAHARDYAMTQRALDQIEAAALAPAIPVAIPAPAPTTAPTLAPPVEQPTALSSEPVSG
jgi:hypothetical protein